jgi:predicted ester cyclase
MEKEIEIKGYNNVNATSHSRHTGGVSIYIRDDITFESVCCISDSPRWWLCGVKIKTDRGFYRIFTVYRSPSHSVNDFLKFFGDWLEENDDTRCKTVIVGDFNVNLNSKSEACRQMKDVYQLRGYKQLVKFNTRVSKNSESLIDYVLSDAPNVTVTHPKRNKIGDHETIKIQCDMFKSQSKTSRVISMQDWKNFDFETLNSILKTQLPLLHSDASVEEKANYLSDLLDNTVEELLSHKVIYLNGRINQPWYTPEMERQHSARGAASAAHHNAAGRCSTEVRDELWKTFTKERNKYTQLLEQGERQFLNDKIDCKKNEPKAAWKTLKTFVSEQTTRKNNIVNANFDATFNESTENNFNQFYVKSVESIVESIPAASFTEKQLITEVTQVECKFKFKQIEMSELVNIVKNLKSTAVPNNVSLNVLLNILETIQIYLLDIINNVIIDGCYPSVWKTSKVIPIPKVKTPKDPQDFRPINILPLFEKILEIVLQKQILKYLKENSILYEMQSGFRENHSCESAIQYILGTWRKMAEDGKVTIAVFLDFKRAFETIDRELLLCKLKKYGFSDCSVKLLSSYLSDRKQYVYANNKKSDNIDVNIGVPQGSVLGPLLFILYINDLPLQLKNMLVKIFADDTLLSISGHSYRETAILMNRALEIVAAWLKIYKVKLNTSKSKYMVIAKSKYKLTSLTNDMKTTPLEIESQFLERVEVFKYLGVMIDCCLKFDEHVSYVIKKAGKKVMYLGRLRNKLSMSTKKLIYNCIVAPHLDYCATVLWRTSEENLDKLQVLQNYAMRSILNCRRRASKRFMLRKIGWLDVRQKIELNVCVMIKKILSGELPSYLSEDVQFASNIHNYPTRNSENLYIPTVASDFCAKSLSHSGFQFYNTLPTHVKNVSKTNAFKQECMKYLKCISDVFYDPS